MSADRRPLPSPLQKNPVALIRSRSPPDPIRTSLELSIPSSTCNEIRQKQVVVVVVLEGGDRLDIVRIIITDVGTDVVREGRERERWVATHQKESSWRRRQIYLSNRRQSPCTTSLALPIVVLPSLYNTSVGGRDIKQPPWPWRPPSIPRRVVIQVIRRRGYNIRHFCMCVCMLDWCRGWFLNWNFGWGRSCYLSLVVDEGDAQIGHGSQDGHQRLNGVAVDHRSILFEIVRCEAALVNDSKLKMRKIGNFSFSFSGREFSNDFF